MTGEREVVVVGGGPAGSTTALLLARGGCRVLLLDRARFPRAKACGECLSPGGVAALRRIGLLERVLELDPARLGGWTLHGPHGSRHDAPFPAGIGTGLGVDRARLDATLLAAAREAGVEVREGVRVVRAHPAGEGGPAAVELAEGDTLSASLVIGADGLRSVVARSLDPDRSPPDLRKASLSVHLEGVTLAPDRGRLLLDPGTTLGLAPLDPEGRRWTLSTVVPSARADHLPRSAEGLVRSAARRLPGLDRARPLGPPLGSGPFDRPGGCPVADGILLVGDAAGYFDPLTGQGIYRALRSAELAAPVAIAALEEGGTSAETLGSYAGHLRRELGPGRRVQRVIQAVLDRPRLLELVLAGLDRGHALPSLVAVTGDARPVSTLFRPRLLAGLLHPSFAS